MKVYVNGRYYDKKNAKVSVFDHGLLYGDGVFEGIRAYSGTVFRCRDHIDRLFDSAHAILLKIPVSKDELEKIIYAILKRNKLSDAYIRVVVTRGTGDLGLDPDKCKEPSLIVITDRIVLYSDGMYKNGMDVVTVPTARVNVSAFDTKIKSLNYLNNILAKVEGKLAGVPEVIMLNSQGFVAECSGDNIFIVQDGDLLTPPEDAGILKGITREVVMELAEQAGIRVIEKNMTRYNLYTTDECFLTGTAAEVIPVVKVDGRVVGTGRPGPVTKKLFKKFRQLTVGAVDSR